jgi:hypothetical protein
MAPERRRRKRKPKRKAVSNPAPGDEPLYAVVGGFLFGLVMLGLGIFIYYQMSNELGLGAESADWPAVNGTIVESNVATGEQTVKGVRVTKYLTEISYDYAVGGKTFSGGRISFDPSMHVTAESAEAVVNRYPVGSEQPVHYDPADPTQSTLVPGIETTSYAMYLIPLFFGCCGGFISLITALMLIVRFKNG